MLCIYTFILLNLLVFSNGDTWIDFSEERVLTPTNSVSFSIGDKIDIIGRNITAISLLRTKSQFECVNNSTGYWGCDNYSDDFYIQILAISNGTTRVIAPENFIDPRVIMNATRDLNGYSVKNVQITNNQFTLLVNHYPIKEGDTFVVTWTPSASRLVVSGNVSFIFSIKVSSFYLLASNLIMDATGINAGGYFGTQNNLLEGKQVTRFRFVHVSGNVTCKYQDPSWFNNWGCSTAEAATYCFAVYNSTAINNITTAVVPSFVDPRIFSIVSNLQYFKMNATINNYNSLQAETVTLESNVILSSNNNYSLQFCELDNITVTIDNMGQARVNIQASVERWNLFRKVSITTDKTIFSVPQEMQNRTIKAVRFLHIFGGFFCSSSSSTHRWGCPDNTNVFNQVFYLNVGNSSQEYIPRDYRDVERSTNGFILLGAHIDDDSIVYEANFKLGSDLQIGRIRPVPFNTSLSFAIYFMYDECSIYASSSTMTGGYQPLCGPCISGFFGDGIKCDDVNECSNPQICGNGANCINTFGSYECVCPGNWSGNPEEGCTSCGNGVCDGEVIKEDCVTCPQDCPIPCDACGDGKCNLQTESCLSCPSDCGRCGNTQVKCPGSPECSGHGTCRSGLCFCDINFSGLSCNQAAQPIVVVVNETSPDITFTPEGKTKVEFQFSIFEIREVNTTNGITAVEKLNNQTYITTFNNVTNATHPTYTFSTILFNNARLAISVWIFEENTIINFVNENLSFSANSIKFDVKIQSWPFTSSKNKLWLLTSHNSPAPGDSMVVCGDDTSQGFDAAGNLRFSQIKIGTSILYGRFLEYASVDGAKKSLEVRAIESTTNKVVVAIIVPFFFDRAIVDPDLSVLVAPTDERNDCNQRSARERNYRKVIIGVTVGVCCAAVIAGIIGITMSKRKAARLRKDTLKRMANANL